MEKLDATIQTISEERSKYGAYENALSFLQTNVSNTKENLTKSEAQLRDADMANEISRLQKNQILLQSSQAMIVQVNQMSQGILNVISKT